MRDHSLGVCHTICTVVTGRGGTNNEVNTGKKMKKIPKDRCRGREMPTQTLCLKTELLISFEHTVLKFTYGMENNAILPFLVRILSLPTLFVYIY